MEYLAMFIWLTICLVLGGMMHAVLRTAFSYRLMAWLAAPGVVVRKFAMTVAAMVTGATVTQVNVYDIRNRDIGFNSKGMGTLSKFLVPVAPLFACAVLLQAFNTSLGTPLNLDISLPGISSVDPHGAAGFMKSFFSMVGGVVRQIFRAEWGSFRMYVLLFFIFSLSLGAGVPLGKFREAFLGVVILVTALALTCSLFGVGGGFSLRSGGSATSVLRSTREFLIESSGMALVMMICGMLAAVVAGLMVRVFEMVSSAATSSGSRDAEEGEEEHEKEKAA